MSGFQDGCTLPENGGLLDLCFGSLLSEVLNFSFGELEILPHSLSVRPLFLVFRRHWVAVAGNERRECPWNRLLLADQGHGYVLCKSLMSNTQFHCALFWFVLQIGSRAVLITGCDSGFGFALAKHLHAKGLIVYAGCLQKVGKTNTVFFTCNTCTDM